MSTDNPSPHDPSAPPPAQGHDSAEALIDEVRRSYELMCEQIGRVVVGQREVIDQLLLCLFCRGHGLLVGVPV